MEEQLIEDQERTCVEPTCRQPFMWTRGEQRFLNRLYESGDIKKVLPPKRCPKCRQARKDNAG